MRKYIYGPGIDQPVSMTEVGDSSSPYYYHYDALGSVVALSDSAGDTVQTYEYSVYGQVAVEDANHPNPYMFAGRRFDMEIGLYYNRARYYNPFTGRFLQADPIGYGDGMNMYAYCTNNPILLTDPTGTTGESLDIEFSDACDVYYEWTGEFKLVNAGRSAMHPSKLSGNIRVAGKVAIGTGVALELKDAVRITGAIMGKAKGVKLGPGAIISSVIGAYGKLMVAMVDKLDEVSAKINRPDTYLNAYIRVKEYRRRKGLSKFWNLFDDNWDEEWAEGSQYGWVEVKGGGGWEADLNAYMGAEAALNAIYEAVQSVGPARPKF